jgi:hypothetical protein
MRQRYEANFRFSLVRVRENAEGIALYNGEQREADQLNCASPTSSPTAGGVLLYPGAARLLSGRLRAAGHCLPLLCDRAALLRRSHHASAS